MIGATSRGVSFPVVRLFFTLPKRYICLICVSILPREYRSMSYINSKELDRPEEDEFLAPGFHPDKLTPYFLIRVYG